MIHLLIPFVQANGEEDKVESIPRKGRKRARVPPQEKYVDVIVVPLHPSTELLLSLV